MCELDETQDAAPASGKGIAMGDADLRTFVPRFHALVEGRIDTWREAIKRWAKSRRSSPSESVPLIQFYDRPGELSPDEKIVVLAAIHEADAGGGVLWMDPWPELKRLLPNEANEQGSGDEYLVAHVCQVTCQQFATTGLPNKQKWRIEK